MLFGGKWPLMGMASMILIFRVYATALQYFAAEHKALEKSTIWWMPRKYDGGGTAELSALKQVQIANYIKGKALIINIHITHHAGTWMCGIMTKFGPTPGFVCMAPGKNKAWPDDISPNLQEHNIFPWFYEYTEAYVERFRALFHFMSQEYSQFAGLHRTNWECENLVSVIVMRDPMERFLSRGRCGEFHSALVGDPTIDNQALFWEYSNSDCADNYALRVLAASDCVNGSDTTLACLEGAKSLMRRFTFILDQACLSDSLIALGSVLHLNITQDSFRIKKKSEESPIDAYTKGMISNYRTHNSVRERINNDTLYDFLQHQFRQDIALYEWSKTQSIVKC